MKNKKLILAASLLAAALTTTGVTLAYLVAKTEEVVNTFTPTSVPIKVEETLANNVKSGVKIKNTSDFTNGTSAYIRAAVVKNWLDADLNVVYLKDDTPDGYTETPKEGPYFNLSDNNRTVDNWYYHTDGYYYFKKPVAPEGVTDVLIDKWGITYPAGSEYILQVEILAQSVQSEPVVYNGDTGTVTAAYDLWGVTLTVDKDGIIKNIQ